MTEKSPGKREPERVPSSFHKDGERFLRNVLFTHTLFQKAPLSKSNPGDHCSSADTTGVLDRRTGGRETNRRGNSPTSKKGK